MSKRETEARTAYSANQEFVINNVQTMSIELAIAFQKDQDRLYKIIQAEEDKRFVFFKSSKH